MKPRTKPRKPSRIINKGMINAAMFEGIGPDKGKPFIDLFDGYLTATDLRRIGLWALKAADYLESKQK